MDLESGKSCAAVLHSSQLEPVHATLSQTWAQSVNAQLNHQGNTSISSSSSSSGGDSDDSQRSIDWATVRLRASQMRTSLARWNEARKLHEQKNSDTRTNRDASLISTTSSNTLPAKLTTKSNFALKMETEGNLVHIATHFVPIRPKPRSEEESHDFKQSRVKRAIAHFDAFAAASGSSVVGPGLTLHVGHSPPGKNTALAQLSVSGNGKASLAAIIPYPDRRPTSPPLSPTDAPRRHNQLKRRRPDSDKEDKIESADKEIDSQARKSGKSGSIHNGRCHRRHSINASVVVPLSESKRHTSCVESENGRVPIELLREKILQQADSVTAAAMRKPQQRVSKSDLHCSHSKEKSHYHDRNCSDHRSHNVKTEDHVEGAFGDARAALVRLRQSGSFLCDIGKVCDFNNSFKSGPNIKKEIKGKHPVSEKKRRVGRSSSQNSMGIKREQEGKKGLIEKSPTTGKTRSSSKRVNVDVRKPKISGVSNALGNVRVSKGPTSASISSKSQPPSLTREHRLTRAQSASLSSQQIAAKGTVSASSNIVSESSGSSNIPKPVKDKTLHPTEPSKQNARKSENMSDLLLPHDSDIIRHSTAHKKKKKIAVRTYSSPSPNVKQKSLISKQETTEAGKALRSSTEADEGNSGKSSPVYGREAECISNLLSLRAGAWT